MDESPNLLIVRTPFQAWFCLQLIDRLKIVNYDLLYITHNNSEEDRLYFKRLSRSATISDYVYLPAARFDLITHLKLRVRIRSWFCCYGYKNIFVASINSLVINALICRISFASLYTFDDGAANLVRGGPYYIDPSTKRMTIYRFIFRGLAVEKVRERISRHYSLYKGFENIVEEGRITNLDGCLFENEVGSDITMNKIGTKRYFIGAPFEEVMSRQEIKKMVDIMLAVGIDGYIKHPREKKEIPIGGVIVNKNGRIAEEVILEDSAGCKVELYGFLSSVMLNLQGISEKRVVFLPSHQRLTGVGELARKSGCQEVYLT